MLCLLGLYWLLKNLFDPLRSWSRARRPLPTPSSRPKAAGRLRSDSRHFSCPEYLPLLRCPHCFAEIRSLAAPAPPDSPRNPEIPPSPQPVLKRRSSDSPPTNPARCSLPSPLLPQEPRVTTPPRSETIPLERSIRASFSKTSQTTQVRRLTQSLWLQKGTSPGLFFLFQCHPCFGLCSGFPSS